MHKKEIAILILGMHRSGTSVLTGSLEKIGFDLGENMMLPTKENPQGYFENLDVHHLNENILNRIDSAWDDIYYNEKQLFCSPEFEQFVLDAKKLVHSVFEKKEIFAIKDPRLNILFPVYHRALQELGIDLRVIFVLRNPIEIVNSLEIRRNFTIEKSSILTLINLFYGELYSRTSPRIFVLYDELISNPLNVIQIINRQLHLGLDTRLEESRSDINNLIDPSLKHFFVDNSDLVFPDLGGLFQLLKEGAKSYTKIDGLRSNFLASKQLFLNNDLKKQFRGLEKQFVREKQQCAYLFVDTGCGFDAGRRFQHEIEGDHNEMKFDLSNCETIRSIRFDPLEDICIVDVEKMELVYESGEIILIEDFKGNFLENSGRRLFFSTNDPQIIQKDIPAKGRLVSINIVVFFIKKGSEVTTALLDRYHLKLNGFQKSLQGEKQKVGVLNQRVEMLQKQHSDALSKALEQKIKVEQYLQSEMQNVSSLKRQIETHQKQWSEERRFLDQQIKIRQKQQLKETCFQNKRIDWLKKQVISQKMRLGLDLLQNERADQKKYDLNKMISIKNAKFNISKKLFKCFRLIGRLKNPKRFLQEEKLYDQAIHLIQSGLFYCDWYLEKNPDVKNDPVHPAIHYLKFGWREGRNPNPLFDTTWYLRHYPDVAEHGMNPLVHYCEHGVLEGRKPNPMFDTAWYLEQNPDVARKDVNPLTHYLEYGSMLGRNPNPLFDTALYLEQHPDVVESGMNPLVHYLNHDYKTAIKGEYCKRIVERKRRDWNNNHEMDFLKTLEECDFDKAFIESTKASIVLPTFNRKESIKYAIESVLAQTHKNWELLIVDDGSTDETEIEIYEYLKNDKIGYFKIDHQGVSVARNTGLKHASGEYIFFIDSDNRWRNQYIERMLRFLVTNSLDSAYCAIALKEDFEDLETQYMGEYFDWKSCNDLNYIDINSFCFRAELLSFAHFDEDIKRLVDWDFILQLTAIGKTAYAPFIGVDYYDGGMGKRITRSEYRETRELEELKEYIQNKNRNLFLNNIDHYKTQYCSEARTQIAVVFHVYHREFVKPALNMLKNIVHDFHLFVTTSLDINDPIFEDIKNSVRYVSIYRFPNLGRDIGPFIELFTTLMKYEYILKIHTKRDLHETKGIWRDELIEPLIGSRESFDMLFQAFSSDNDLIWAGSKHLYLSSDRTDSETRKHIKELMRLSKISSLPKVWGFFAGTMFFARIEFLKPLFVFEEYQLKYKSCEQKDGLVEHALERFLGILANQNYGKKIGLIDSRLSVNNRLEIRTIPFKGSKEPITHTLRKLSKLGDSKTKVSNFPNSEAKGLVFFFPDYRKTNPYQSLVYKDLDKFYEICPGTIDTALRTLETIDKSVVFHLHWTSVVVGVAPRPETENRVNKFVETVKRFVEKGGILVWTIHNMVSHEGDSPDLEIKLCRNLARFATFIHIHSQSVADLVKAHYTLPPEKLLVGPHGSYVNVYPDTIDRKTARKHLGIPENSFVFLFLGQVRGYKGIDDLVKAFQILKNDESIKYQSWLIIAGNPVNFDSSGIESVAAEMDSFILDLREIPDEELQVFLRAADFMVLPYKQILTSGSVYLALSYSLPVIAPRMGIIGEVVEDGFSGFLYENATVDGLKSTMVNAISLSEQKCSEFHNNARERAIQLTWDQIRDNLNRAFSVTRVSNIRVETLLFPFETRQVFTQQPVLKQEYTPRISIVVLHYQHMEDTTRCIESVLSQTDADFETFIVSNDDTPDSFVHFGQKYPQCTVIQSSGNVGYAAGNNNALNLICRRPFEYVLILNPDAVLPTGTLRQLIHAADSYPDADIFGPRIVFGHCPDTVWFGGGLVRWENGLECEHLYLGKPTTLIEKDVIEVDYITGACLLFRSNLIDSVGFLPEDYFLYFEETDWCLCAKNLGSKIVVFPKIEVLHYKRSEEGGIPTLYYLYYYCRNAITMSKKFREEKVGDTEARLREKALLWIKRVSEVAPSEREKSIAAIESGITDGKSGIIGFININDRIDKQQRSRQN